MFRKSMPDHFSTTNFRLKPHTPLAASVALLIISCIRQVSDCRLDSWCRFPWAYRHILQTGRASFKGTVIGSQHCRQPASAGLWVSAEQPCTGMNLLLTQRHFRVSDKLHLSCIKTAFLMKCPISPHVCITAYDKKRMQTASINLFS